MNLRSAASRSFLHAPAKLHGHCKEILKIQKDPGMISRVEQFHQVPPQLERQQIFARAARFVDVRVMYGRLRTRKAMSFRRLPQRIPIPAISVVQRSCCFQPPFGQPFSISPICDPSCRPVAMSVKHPCLFPLLDRSFSACLFLLLFPAPPCLPWNFFLVSPLVLCISHLIHLMTYDLGRKIKRSCLGPRRTNS